MRGVRDLFLVVTVATSAMALGGISTESSGFERGSLSTNTDIDASVMPVGVGLEGIDHDQTAARPGRERSSQSTARRRTASLPERRPMHFNGPWRERPTPEANDLRGFLANMARATRGGTSIGITGEDVGSVWVDDAAK